MGLKDRLVKALALRYVRGKYKDLRGKDKETQMGKILEVLIKIKETLSGWKLLIGVTLIFGAKVYDALNNGHAGDFVGAVLTTLQWLPDPTLIQSMPISAAVAAVGGLIAVAGYGGKIWRVQKQLRAGSSITGLLSAEGFKKESEAK